MTRLRILTRPVGGDVHPRGRGDSAALLEPDRDTGPGLALLIAPRATVGPADLGGRGIKHGRQALVVEVPVPEGDGVDAQRDGQLVHVRLAGEVVRRRGQRTVGALRQRRRRRLVAQRLMRHTVRSRQAGRAGVDVGERPGQQVARRVGAAGHVDDSGRAADTRT